MKSVIIVDKEGREVQTNGQGQLKSADRWTGWIFALLALDHALLFLSILL